MIVYWEIILFRFNKIHRVRYLWLQNLGTNRIFGSYLLFIRSAYRQKGNYCSAWISVLNEFAQP